METLKIIEDIRARYPKVPWGNPRKEPVWIGRKKDTAVLDADADGNPAMFAIMHRNPKGEDSRFAYCTSEYQLVHHEVALWLLEDKLKGMPEYGTPVIKPCLLQDGRKMKVIVEFPEVKYEIRAGDPVSPRLIQKNSYDLQWEFNVNFGARQEVCTNGLIAHKILASMKKKHRQNLDPAFILNTIMTGMSAYSEQIGIWQGWAQTALKEEEVEMAWEKLPFGNEYKEQIKALPSAQHHLTLDEYLRNGSLTVWDFHGLLTQFLSSSQVESELVRLEKTEKVAEVFHKMFPEKK